MRALPVSGPRDIERVCVSFSLQDTNKRQSAKRCGFDAFPRKKKRAETPTPGRRVEFPFPSGARDVCAHHHVACPERVWPCGSTIGGTGGCVDGVRRIQTETVGAAFDASPLTAPSNATEPRGVVLMAVDCLGAFFGSGLGGDAGLRHFTWPREW